MCSNSNQELTKYDVIGEVKLQVPLPSGFFVSLRDLHRYRELFVYCLDDLVQEPVLKQCFPLCAGKFVPGCYALTVTGELSEEMQVLLFFNSGSCALAFCTLS